MDSALFEEWLRDLNMKFSVEDRKVAMIVYNCPAHPHIENLSHMKLFFLPPNTTSVSQPMDKGVIRCLKAHYRRRMVKLTICNLYRDWPLPKINVMT